MIIKYDPLFLERYKKLDVRIRKSLKEKIAIFQHNPFDLQLDNHQLEDEYEGYRSIDITADYRAIYEEINEQEEIIAYFVAIGTHPELYSKVGRGELSWFGNPSKKLAEIYFEPSKKVYMDLNKGITL